MKQLLQYFFAILLWIAGIVLWATGVTFWLFGALLILHGAELLIVGYRTGRKFGTSPLKSIVLCLLFGYIWWLPVRRAMKADDLTEADFVEDGKEPWREQVEA